MTRTILKVVALSVCVSMSGLGVQPLASAAPLENLRGDGFAFVAFTPPKAKTLRLPRNGRCVTPKFVFQINTNYEDSMFNGQATVRSGRKTYGQVQQERLLVNVAQGVTLTKPICKAGTYTLTVKGKVTSIYPVDGQSYQTYANVSGSQAYRVIKKR